MKLFRASSILLFGSLIAVCGAGYAGWQLIDRHGAIFGDRPAIKRIPASLHEIPLESKNKADEISASQPSIPSNSTVRYALGDRLKITVFERVDLSDEEQNNIPATGLIERTELTGDYVVQENGYIFLPLLGAIEAEGQSLEQVVASLQETFKQSMRRPAKASVVLLDREPVYLVGKGINPGAFKYSPGMTVLHALALSGALKDESSDLYARIEYARGLEKLEICIQRLKKSLAQAAALRAQLSGQAPEIPPRLIELAGEQDAKKLVGAAAATRKLIVSAKQPQIAAYQAALASARQEAQSHMSRIALLEEHTKLEVQRRDALADIRRHNDGLASALLTMENEVATVKEKKLEAVAALTKAQDGIAQATQNLARLEAATTLELQNENIGTESEIAEQEATLKATRRLISDLRIASLRMARKGQNLTYEIVRRGRNGVYSVKATETAELFPGDLIQVTNAEDNSGI